MEWIPVEKLEVKRGEFSRQLYFVQAQEFGQRPIMAICRVWWGTGNDKPTWYLEASIYNLDRPYPVAEDVQYFIPVPEPAPYRTMEERLKR